MQKDKSDVGTLLQALQRTLEFEEELAERFGGTGAAKDEPGKQAVRLTRAALPRVILGTFGSGHATDDDLLCCSDMLEFVSRPRLGWRVWPSRFATSCTTRC